MSIDELTDRVFSMGPYGPIMGKTKAGTAVSEQGSLAYAGVYACVRVLSNTTGMLPWHTYEKNGEDSNQAIDHPVYYLLHDEPNPEIHASRWKRAAMGHVLTWGNHYSEIEFGNDGYPRALWPIPPNRCTPMRINSRLWYQVVLPSGEPKYLRPDQVLHVAGLGFDGIKGYSPVALAREAIGLGVAAEEFGSTFFSQGANMGGIAKHPGELSETGHKNLESSLNAQYAGLGKAHRIMLLEEGMDYVKLGFPPADAQFLETRKFQIAEAARFYGVPLHLLGELDKATFSNIEQQGLEYVIYSLMPWLDEWEKEGNRKLFTRAERRRLYTKFTVGALLRGDTAARYDAYAIGRQWGWLSADDVRKLEDMNPLPDGQGKMYIVPLNMVPASQAGQEPAGAAGDGDDGNRAAKNFLEVRAQTIAKGRRTLADKFKPLIKKAAENILKRETAEVRAILAETLGTRDANEFKSALKKFYDTFSADVRAAFYPTFDAFAEAIAEAAAAEVGADVKTLSIREFTRGYIDTFLIKYIGASQGQLEKAADDAATEGTDPVLAVEARIKKWEENRPESIATRQGIQASNAFALATYASAGILLKRWVARGKSCPYCKALNGRVVGIWDGFLDKDKDFKPDGADKPLRTGSKIGNPPLHKGCDCHIIASK